MSEKTTLKQTMSKILDNINGIQVANNHTDGSYETKDMDIETFQNQLSILWVFLTTDIEQLEAELHTANAENEDLCDNIDAVRQDLADMRAGTLEGKLLKAKGTCTWRFREPFDGDEAWDAECGATWTFIEGGLKDNGAVFCLKCGRLIKEVRQDKESDHEV